MTYQVALRCAEAVARRAGKMLLRGNQSGFQVDLKGVNDLVTNVDREIEAFIRDELKALFPDDAFFGEETGQTSNENGGVRTWVVDPIDGTMNFTQGIPFSCVSIALLEDDLPKVGVIYEPYRDEIFSAREGGGTEVNGVSVSVSASTSLADSVVATGFPPQKATSTEDNLRIFSEVAFATRGARRLGSAALDLAYVSAGRFDGFWEFHLNPWDTLAGVLLVREAGGRVTNEDGDLYRGSDGCIVASNGRIHDSLTRLVGKK